MEMTIAYPTKEPIINGSFNHNLTKEEATAFDLRTKRTLCWYLVVSMDYANNFNDVDPAIFTKSENLPNYKEIEEADEVGVNTLLCSVMDMYKNKHYDLLNKTEFYRTQLGRNIYKAQTELGFGGFLKMDFARLIGYVHAEGGWNNKTPAEICPMIRRIEGKAPRRDYGVNNCNTGGKMHHWTTSGEYITLVYEYFTGDKDLPRLMDFYKTVWEPEGQKAHADSIRYELLDHEHGAHTLELIMWWD